MLDGELNIQNMAVNAFGGSMLMNGLYSTKEPNKPKVDFNLNIQEVAFTEIFSQIGDVAENGQFSNSQQANFHENCF